MARRWQRGLGIVVLVLVILIALAITVTIGWQPIIGPKTRSLNDRRFEASPARLERGRYLVTAVTSGISYYDAGLFLRVMREGKVGARQLHASMPWWFFGKMTDDDLKSMFA